MRILVITVLACIVAACYAKPGSLGSVGWGRGYSGRDALGRGDYHERPGYGYESRSGVEKTQWGQEGRDRNRDYGRQNHDSNLVVERHDTAVRGRDQDRGFSSGGSRSEGYGRYGVARYGYGGI